MGVRFRRSVKIAPGLRLNFNKNSMGLTMGPRGAHYTVNTSGRVTTSVGLPGTGLWYQESRGGGGRTSTRTARTPKIQADAKPPIHIDQPGFFASGGERAFYHFVQSYLVSDSNKSLDEMKAAAEKVKTEFPDVATYIDFVMIGPIARERAEDALPIIEKIWNLGSDFLKNQIALKYFDEFQAAIPIARGIYYHTDYNHNYLSFTYSEILQAMGNPQKALEVIENVTDAEFKEIATLDLYLALKRYDDVLKETDELENIDENSMIKLIFRAIAFRESGQLDLAIETLKLALAKKSRPKDLINYALYERACTYIQMGKKAYAIKDLQKILVSDSTDEAAKEKLKELH